MNDGESYPIIESYCEDMNPGFRRWGDPHRLPFDKPDSGHEIGGFSSIVPRAALGGLVSQGLNDAIADLCAKDRSFPDIREHRQ